MSKNLIVCQFTSEWDSGAVIMTDCKFDPDTFEVFPKTSNAAPKGSLVREYITLQSGEELEVCRECHGFVMRPVMNPDPDGNPTEDTECSDSDCPSKERPETICCDQCGHEYDRHLGDDCPNCGHNNHEQYVRKYGED